MSRVVIVLEHDLDDDTTDQFRTAAVDAAAQLEANGYPRVGPVHIAHGTLADQIMRHWTDRGQPITRRRRTARIAATIGVLLVMAAGIGAGAVFAAVVAGAAVEQHPSLGVPLLVVVVGAFVADTVHRGIRRTAA